MTAGTIIAFVCLVLALVFVAISKVSLIVGCLIAGLAVAILLGGWRFGPSP